jgi:hypothetical protein
VTKLINNLRRALGKISFTMDVWSSKALQPYLAVTAHWLGLRAGTSQPALHQALLAFRRIRGAHSSQRMARIIFNILDLADIPHKVCGLYNCRVSF